MSDIPNRDVAVFSEALQLPPGERAAFLEIACGSDHKLRQVVEALLAGYELVGDFLEQSPHKNPFETKPGLATNEKAGDRIGRYRLLQQIGEGGCSVVFMAEQEDPARRRVALKIIKPGMDTKSVIARFEAKRQALAMMDHPNIAKILDAGVTESGRPFFVMELVRGVRITDYCGTHSLTTEERLKLFLQVSQAIQHAHQKGIIHRDIKPSNILVTITMEGAALPVIIDFGAAKAATNQQLTDETLFTAFEMITGSPDYMSPEQMELANIDVDTRSDIYSLGVLLYELLTGSTPFDTRALLTAGFDEIRRVIREREPSRPSTRLSKMSQEELSAIARSHKSKPRALIHAICGDLDSITMKALEKDRRRRYQTACVMALDIECYLASEPIVARPASTVYRVQKLMRRNKFAFAASSAIAMFLLLGVTACFWQTTRANRETRRAVVSEQQATAKAAAERLAREESESILKFMNEVFQSPDPARDGRTITVAETLDRAATRLETDLADQPDRRAALQEKIASTYAALGLPRQAIPLQEAVRDYFLKTRGLEDGNTLADMAELANSYFAVGRLDEAFILQQEVLKLRRKVNGSENSDTLAALGELANTCFTTGRRTQALKLREEVLALSRKMKVDQEDPATLAAMDNCALSYASASRVDLLGEIKLREEVLRLSGKADAAENLVTMVEMSDQAKSYFAAGRGNEAIKLQEKVLKLRQTVDGPDHPDTLMAMDDLANEYFAVGRKDDSLKLQEEVLALRRKVNGPNHPDTLMEMNNVIGIYFVTGRYDEAIRLGEELLAIERKGLDPEHPDPMYRVTLGILANSYADVGRKDEARKLREESLTFDVKIREETLAYSSGQHTNSAALAINYADLGYALHELGNFDEAINDWQEARRIDPAGTQEVAYWLGKSLVDRERYAEALPILRATQKSFPDGDRRQETARRLALVEALEVGHDSKLGASDRVLAALRKMVTANPLDSDQAKQLATVYLWLGQTNEHLAVCREFLDLAADSQDPATHERAAKAYLAQDHPDQLTLKLAVASARLAMKMVATNDVNRPWFLVTAAMAAVRDGKPAEAESLLDEVLRAPGDDPNLDTLALAYRTLARAHLGRTEEARADLAELEKQQPILPVPPAPSAILLEPDFLAVSLAHEEAKALLEHR
jgi:tetratricopeptide (TPR) repeat protein